MASHALTTTDNPFHPIDDFAEWFAYDTRAGHHTLSFLARIARTSDELSERDQDLILEAAIDEIVRENVSGLYTKVKISSDESET